MLDSLFEYIYIYMKNEKKKDSGKNFVSWHEMKYSRNDR